MNESNEVFANVDDDFLAKRIVNAKDRVVFVAPGLRSGVANALAAAIERLHERVTIVLDMDAEVCRLGYGDIEGLELIQTAAAEASVLVLHQPGVRIGLLIADEDTIVYSPAPLLIEAGSSQPEKPNAIVLQGAVPPTLAAACGLGDLHDRQIGLDPVNQRTFSAVKQDLQANPPKEFNIARVERVFNSALQFVEVEILDYRLRTRKVKLDPSIFGLSDEYLRQRVENTFKPFEDSEFLTVEIPRLDEQNHPHATLKMRFSPDQIESERLRIKRELLFDVPRFGVVLRRAHKPEFERQMRRLQQQIALYMQKVQAEIEQRVAAAKARLTASLLEIVLASPPAAWRKYMSEPGRLERAEAERLLSAMLDKEFDGLTAGFHPTVRWLYKDVTYETIHNPDFRRALERPLGKDSVAALFKEFDAAPEQLALMRLK